MTDNQRTDLHWYHYYVIVDLYFHSYFQQSQELEQSYTEGQKVETLYCFAYMRFSDSAQSFMVSRTSLLKVKKCKNDLFHTLVLFSSST